MKKLMCFALLLMMCTLPAIGVEIATSEMGRSLFESAQLGKAGRSCSTCHPAGKGLDKVGDFSDAELKDVINACVRDALQGTPFDSESQELNALLLHVRSYQGSAR